MGDIFVVINVGMVSNLLLLVIELINFVSMVIKKRIFSNSGEIINRLLNVFIRLCVYLVVFGRKVVMEVVFFF